MPTRLHGTIWRAFLDFGAIAHTQKCHALVIKVRGAGLTEFTVTVAVRRLLRLGPFERKRLRARFTTV